MSEITIRPATAADLDQVYDIWYQAEVEDYPDPPPRGDVPAIFYHELDTGTVLVAEGGGRVLGYTALTVRGDVAYLSELYVRQDRQSSGVGQGLLARILPRDGRTCCTLSSDDPRALALYIRAGLRPRWPHYLLQARSERLGDLPATGVDVVEAQPSDPDLVRWDAEIGGRHRPQDHACWLAHAGAVPLWFRRRGEVIGYGYAQRRSHEALWQPEALSLGPLGGRTAGDALACICAAVGWAAQRAPILRLGVPAAHPGLPVLLEAGFHITYVETFVSTAEDAFADPRRYLPSSSTLY